MIVRDGDSRGDSKGGPPMDVMADWQAADRVRWSFQHMAEIFPTAEIRRGDGPVAVLPAAPVDVRDLPVELGDGSVLPVGDVIAATETDGWLVLHRGQLVVAEYLGDMKRSTRHLLMSVSKSMVSTVAGVLVEQGLIKVEAPVATYVPALAASGYAGATVRHLLDMRSGVRFSEDYLDADAHIRMLDAAVGWAPRRAEDSPRTLKDFLSTLQQARDHGGAFEYRSCETDVLGWVCEAAADVPFAELISELVWSRLGAEHDAYICVDSEGTGIFDGGICATMHDVARFGASVVNGGRSLTGEQVVPRWWVEDTFTGGPDSAPAFAGSAEADEMPGGRYRNMFWSPSTSRDVVLCMGIHGQLVYMNRAAETVGVKFSSWPLPLDDWKHMAALRMFEAISARLVAG